MSISAPVVSNAGPLMALAKLNLLHRPAVEGDGRRPGADEGDVTYMPHRDPGKRCEEEIGSRE